MELFDLQKNFQSLVIDGFDVGEDSLENLWSCSPLKDEFLPSKRLSGMQRARIYRDMYPLRAQDALQADFPCIFEFFEEEEQWDIVIGYIGKYPSRSFTLDDLGDSFPSYIEVKRGAAFGELALFEKKIALLFDKGEPIKLNQEMFSEATADCWLTAVLEKADSVELCSFEHNIANIYSSWYEGNKVFAFEKKPCFSLLSVCDHKVIRTELRQWQYWLLKLLFNGIPLGEAFYELYANQMIGEDPAAIFEIFRDWIPKKVFKNISFEEA